MLTSKQIEENEQLDAQVGPRPDCRKVSLMPVVRPQSPSPSYALADLKQLAREWANDPGVAADDNDRLAVSVFCAWLARKERETNEREL